MVIKEGTNKAIVVNSTILYARLIIVSLCGFFSARFALQALGIVDYGLFSVLGGVIAFIDVANTVMINTTTRFMTVALGKGDPEEINKQFNINLKIHVFTALFSLIIACTIGYWYIYNYLNYDGSIKDALIVFTFSIVAADISMLGVPFSGLITAKEKFFITSYPEVVSYVLKLIVSYLLIHFFTHKLLIYAGLQSILTIYPVVIYMLYCKRHFPDIVKITKVNDKSKYKEVLKFSGWTLYGTMACIAKGQGAAIVVNLFFTTAMNAALGIANILNGLVSKISLNLSKPMFPQITKSYAAGDMNRNLQLLCMTTKFTYLMILLVSCPFLINAEWIIGLWLVEVPPMTSKIIVLLIVDLLISSFNSGVATTIKASGKIGMYEFAGNTLRLLSIVIAYFFLKNGFPVETLFYIYIVFSFIIVFIDQIILHKVTNIDNMILIKHSYLPSILVTILYIPFLFIKIDIMPLWTILIGLIYLGALIYFFALSKQERGYIKTIAETILNKLSINK